MNERPAVHRSAPALIHPTLDGGGESEAAHAAAEDVRLTDQQRLGVVLQAAALLAHLDHAGLRLERAVDDPWAAARIDGDGLLRGLAARPGRDRELPQVLLLGLLRKLFRSVDGGVAGRGAARRVARELIELWSQELEPQSADQAVAQLLDSAPYLWGDGFVEARTCLAAGVVDSRRPDAPPRPWLAAPGRIRRRFLQRADDHRHLLALLRSDQARDLWDGVDAASDPVELRRKGALRRAVAAWQRRKKLGRRDKVACAECLLALGRFADAVDLLRTISWQDDVDVTLCLARCQLDLGERRAAAKTLRSLPSDDESPTDGLTLDDFLRRAEIEVRLVAASGPKEAAREWIERLRRLAASDLPDALDRHRHEARMLAAGAAFDAGDMDTMAELLDESRESARGADRRLSLRWQHMEGLRRLGVGDGPGAAEHVAAALAVDRRNLSPARAGRLWNDLAVARALADRLPEAERACRHALRLLSRTQGPARLTLALYNLAEVRLRRGRWQGVVGTLERSAAENRKMGNRRGLLLDLELWVRVELAQGRSAAALARCAEARELIDDGAPGRTEVFALLAARALGWLGRAAEAATELARVSDETMLELEPEERPAILALAGRLTDAAAEAHSTPWEPLWTSLVAAEHPSLDAWGPAERLEPYRSARLVLDVETLLPGLTPSLQLRRAVHAFRSLGVEAFAETLERRTQSPWLALREYLDAPDRSENCADVEERLPAGDCAARLLRAAGYDEARLEWRGTDGVEVLVDGSGGEQVLEHAVGERDLVLRSQQVDSVLEALFALLRHDLERRQAVAPTPVAFDDEFGEPGLRDGIVGRSEALRRALHRLDRLASGDLPLLVLGESGTGKELVARRVHRKSRRHGGEFLPINCAALSETLIQSDLFGHVRGSFTGADRDRAGVFEAARGGTVFLDEIGDLPLNCQGKLLRVLQEGEIRRVGESFARKVDVRVVAATHRDLEQMVADGEFRQDLFYRLRVAKVELPPLRERGEDLVRLAEFLLRRIPAGPQRLAPEAVRRLRAYSWPGNVRELRNILEVASALAEGDVVTADVLDLPTETEAADPDPAVDYHHQVESLRRRLVSEALERAEGNRAEAARSLGMSRQALSYLVKQLGLS